MKTSIAATAAMSSAAKRPKAAATEAYLAIAPMASGAGTRGTAVKRATVDKAAECEKLDRLTASAKPQGTTAPQPKPMIAKPTTPPAKPRSAATIRKPIAATARETIIIRR